MRIFLDVDGVCGDIHLALANLLNMTYEELIGHCEKGDYNQPYIPDVHDGNIWEHLGPQLSDDFWATLPDLPWFPDLYHLLNRFGPVTFLTSTAGWPAAASGRVKWVASKFGTGFQDFILTSRKDLLASPDSVLVDDCQDNIDAFRGAGGRAILIPQRWNHGDEGNLVNHKPAKDYILWMVNLAMRGIMNLDLDDPISKWSE